MFLKTERYEESPLAYNDVLLYNGEDSVSHSVPILAYLRYENREEWSPRNVLCGIIAVSDNIYLSIDGQ